MPESSFDFLQNGHEPLNCLGVVVGEEEAFAAIQGFNSSHIFRNNHQMAASKFLVQTDTSVFDELVKASLLPCFTTDYISDRESAYPNRVCVPIRDAAADVTFYLVTKNKGVRV